MISPTLTSAAHSQPGQRLGSTGISRSGAGGDVGVAASITRLNQPGPASSRTVGVASTVVAGSASAATAASIAGVFSRTISGAAPIDTASTSDAIASRTDGSSVTALTRQRRPSAARRTSSRSDSPTGLISTTPAPCTARAVTASRAIHGGTVAPNRPRQSGGSSG